MVPCMGGGGRPGDTDKAGSVGMDVFTFTRWSQLSGLVPLVCVNSGRCFAGNSALLGCADVVIATENSTIGMGGPAMIEGGGLGVFTPEDIGPMDVQVPNGVVDLAVQDEAEAVAMAKRYLAYFQGALTDWQAPDQRRMRRLGTVFSGHTAEVPDGVLAGRLGKDSRELSPFLWRLGDVDTSHVTHIPANARFRRGVEVLSPGVHITHRFEI